MPPDIRKYEFDPVFVNSRREAKFTLCVFAIFACYTVGVSYAFGYQSPNDVSSEVSLTLGMPSWVFWGIVVPWFLANVVTAWYCFCFMKDDPLGDASAPAPALDGESEDGESGDAQVEDGHG